MKVYVVMNTHWVLPSPARAVFSCEEPARRMVEVVNAQAGKSLITYVALEVDDPSVYRDGKFPFWVGMRRDGSVWRDWMDFSEPEERFTLNKSSDRRWLLSGKVFAEDHSRAVEEANKERLKLIKENKWPKDHEEGRTVTDEIEDVSNMRPHLVILGAGASKAADILSGSRFGKPLPEMKDLVRLLRLEDPLMAAGIEPPYDDFESVYSSLCEDESLDELRQELDRLVHEHFSAVQITEEPTLYDHLILSLRAKDTIATFNWDPLLLQAYGRNSGVCELPRLLFLHGNVAVGYCDQDHKLQSGWLGKCCTECGQPYKPTRLLYPIKNKDYQSDSFIKANWKELANTLKRAYVLTIFGYSAPSTDIEAMELMKEAWGPVEEREFEETEIVDILPEDALYEKWSQFIMENHWRPASQFRDSILGRHPRRSCEAIYSQTMEVEWLVDHPLPDGLTLSELHAHLSCYFMEEARSRPIYSPDDQ
ncbi:hypothetical protein IT575_01395 [bacterium]|nr:hypothetical protein [bacterium]